MMKKLDINSLRRRIAFHITMAMLTLAVSVMFAAALIQSHREEIQEEDYANQIHLGIKHVVKHHIKDYSFRAKRMIQSENLEELMKSKDRKGLYELYKKKWDLMVQQEENLKIMHFHLADGTSFLRMHKPEVFGDKMTEIRPMIREVHSSHKKIAAFETGKHANVYRIVTPIFDKSGHYLGALEIGINPKFILNAIREIHGFYGMVFIKEDGLFLPSISSNINIDGYILQSKLTPELKKISSKLELIGKLENGIEFEENSTTYRTHLFVLDNFDGEARVKIIFFQDISDFGVFSSYLLWSLFLFIGVVLTTLIYLVYRRIEAYQKNVSEIYEEQIKRLDESENRFRTLYEEAPNAYQSLDINANLLNVNLKWCEELGFTKEEVIGKNFIDFLAEEDLKKFEKNFFKFKNDGKICGVEFKMVCKNGEYITIAANGKIIYDEANKFSHTQCSFINITHQKELEIKLKNNEKYLQTIFDVIPSIMITINGDEIDKANPAMLDFFNYETIEEFKNDHDCVCDYFIKSDDCLMAKIDETDWLEYILQRRDKLHKVCMNKGSKRHYFIVQAHALELDGKKRSVVIFSDITEIEDLDERLGYAIKGGNDGLWDWNIETNELFLAPKWKEMLGYSDDELENCFNTWEERIHPEDLQMIYDNVAKSHADPDYVFNIVIRLRHKDGHWVWIWDRGHTIYNEDGKAVRMIGFHTDISDMKKLENNLRVSQHQFEQFMKYIPASIMIKDENHRIIYANKRANTFFKQENIIGKKSEDLLPSQMIKKISNIDELILKEGTHEELLELFDDNGKKLVYRNLGFKIVDDDKTKIGIVSIDITKEYDLKEYLYEQEELMIAQSRHAAMGEMISMIAHQWRQPISVIAMDANNILADIELETLQENSLRATSEDIIKQTQELSKTIDDFRNFFRPEKNAQEVVVKELFNDALGVIGKALENSQVEFILELDENKKITTYSRELMQVFINIIKNAKEALTENDIENKKIFVYTSEDEENFTVRICDNAGGVSAENMEKIFNPYFTTKGEKNGTGLGLYMSKTIVTKHLQGSLTVENDDEGACFEITIPHVIKEI